MPEIVEHTRITETTECHHPGDYIKCEVYGVGAMGDICAITCQVCGLECVVEASAILLAWVMHGEPQGRKEKVAMRQALFQKSHPSRPYAPHSSPGALL